MSKLKLNLIGAVAKNMGIGINGHLPWKLQEEMAYFTRMTTRVSEPTKKNAVIMGRRSWDCIPDKDRPLCDRVNIVLTHNVDKIKKKMPDEVIVVGSLDEAIKQIQEHNCIENTWVIGGSAIYKKAIEHKNCDKIYLTEIQETFECDTFFPEFDKKRFQMVQEDGVPTEEQNEGGVCYYFRIYKKISH